MAITQTAPRLLSPAHGVGLAPLSTQPISLDAARKVAGKRQKDLADLQARLETQRKLDLQRLLARARSHAHDIGYAEGIQHGQAQWWWFGLAVGSLVGSAVVYLSLRLGAMY